MSSLVPKLGELLKEEYKLHKGVRKQVQSLSRELEVMHAALRKVADVPPDELDEQVMLWARDVRELSYDMEDIIDDFLVRVEGGHEATANTQKLKGLIKKMGSLFSKGKARRQIAGAIQDIDNQLQEVAKMHGRYTVDSIVAKPAVTSTVDPRLLALYKDAAQLVGIDGPRDTLMRMLSQGHGATEKKMKIVSIVGSGGIGKTTLAKTVYDKLFSRAPNSTGISLCYDSPRISGRSSSPVGSTSCVEQPAACSEICMSDSRASHYNSTLAPKRMPRDGFDCGAFVPVGQNPDMKKVFKDILIDLDKQKYTNFYMIALDERQLIDELREFLKDKRYFIVIDDIWDKKTWEIIRCALVDCNCGSRIIATTRICEIAKDAGDVYKLQPLSSENSEKLFLTRIVDDDGKWPQNHCIEIHDKILKKCGGVPLAIVTIASLLASKPGEDWSEVYNSIGFEHGSDNNDLENTRKILSFSYYNLPYHLKTCLLYLNVFPEDYLIQKYILIWKWIAEGFINDEGIGLLEIGESYFNELINRSMIQPMEQLGTGHIYACRVHDMVVDLIRSLSSKENFVTILGNKQQAFSHGNARRLAIQNRIEGHNSEAYMGMEHVRSFSSFHCGDSMTVVSPSFRVLRVLAIEHCEFMKDYKSLQHVGNLLHLRYLGLTNTPIHEVPKEIGKLKFLQALDLRGTGVEELPSSVGRLTQLHFLCTDKKTRVPDWIGNLTSLQMLLIYPNTEKSTQFVKELGNLRELRILFTKIDISDETLERGLVESLGNLHKLRFVSIVGKSLTNGATCQKMPMSLGHLNSLYLGCLQFSRLPEWINSSHLPNLSYLAVKVQVLQDQDMETLGRMPYLYGLSLVSTYNLLITITGQHSCFRKLRSFSTHSSLEFRVQGMHNESETAPVIMPSLETIKFTIFVRFLKDSNRGLYNLGLENLHSLQKITVSINCTFALPVEVEDAEVALRHAAAVHPNRPTLEISRSYEDRMLSTNQYRPPTIYSAKVIEKIVNVREQKDKDHYFNFCRFLYHPCLQKVSVSISCENASVEEVEEAEAALRYAVDVHPNHPTLELTRCSEDKMMLPDQHQQPGNKGLSI